MQIFNATLNQMLVLFVFIVLGYFLNRKKILPENTATVISKLETNVLVPCLVFNTFYKYCTVQNIQSKLNYILYGAVITALSVLVAVILSRVFTKDNYLQKIYAYSFAIANYTFVGNSVVVGIFGEDMLFDYLIFTLPLSIYCYSFGTSSLIPVKDSKKFSFKMFLNPTFGALLLGAVAGLISLPLPRFLTSAVSSASACMSPFAMILTGFVVADFKLKELLSIKKVYFATFLRLILIPLAFVFALKFFNTEQIIITLTLAATAMPLGLNTVVFPAAYGGDITTGASMALISHVISVITIPVMFAIFV